MKARKRPKRGTSMRNKKWGEAIFFTHHNKLDFSGQLQRS
jgi:hypothetical protein